MKSVILILAIPFVISIAHSQSQPGKTSVDLDDSLAVSVIEAINRNEFSLADRIIQEQLSEDSTSLEWLFLRGMRNYAELFELPGFKGSERKVGHQDDSVNLPLLQIGNAFGAQRLDVETDFGSLG